METFELDEFAGRSTHTPPPSPQTQLMLTSIRIYHDWFGIKTRMGRCVPVCITRVFETCSLPSYITSLALMFNYC